MEQIGNGVVVYSMGDFIFDLDRSEQTDEGLIVELTFDGSRLAQIDIHPTIELDRSQPNLLDPPDGQLILERIRTRHADSCTGRPRPGPVLPAARVGVPNTTPRPTDHLQARVGLGVMRCVHARNAWSFGRGRVSTSVLSPRRAAHPYSADTGQSEGHGAAMVRNVIRRIPVATQGQGLAEYALILALVAIVAIIALLFLGGQVSSILSDVGNSV